MSAGADRKANAQGPVRGSCGLLELLQRGVALEALGESGSSLGAKAVARDTASMGAEAGAEACQRALTNANARAAAHFRLVICVSLSMEASAEAPSTPMSLPPILQARDRMGTVREDACQWALTERQARGGGALERGHSAPLERLAQLGEALG